MLLEHPRTRASKSPLSACHQLSAAGLGTDSTPRNTSDSSQGSEVTGARSTAREEDNSRAEATQGRSTVDKAIEAASAAGGWAVRTGERQGQRLLQLGRDWLATGKRQEGSTLPRQPGVGKGKTAEHHAAGIAVEEVQRQEEVPSAKASDSLGLGTRKTGADPVVGSDSKGSAEGAWRRGRLDGNDKQR